MDRVRNVVKNIRLAIILSLVIVFDVLAASPAHSCTLWAVAGDKVENQGVLIVKNRDWKPNHQQILEIVTPSKGYRYLRLNTIGNSTPGTKAGINEYGLSAVNASPPSYLDKPENYLKRQGSSWILAHYRSVSEALSALNEGKWADGPGFHIIADSKEVAMIEFGLNGEYRVESTNSGVVFHTNHYINPDLQKLNVPQMESSQRRFNFMKNFLESKKAFSLDSFVSVSKNPTIWITGGTVQTLSTWIVFYPEGGQPRLVIRMANPGNMVNEYTIPVEDVFNGAYDIKQVR